MTARTRSSRPRGAEARDALVRAAALVLERDGLRAVTTRSVAAEAGVPHGTVHYWFADKASMLSAAMEMMLHDVRAAITTDGGGDDLSERLRAVQSRVTSLPRGRQLGLYELTLDAARSGDLSTLAEEQYQTYAAATLQELEPWGERLDRDLPGGTQALAMLVIAVMDGLSLAALSSPDRAGLTAAHELFLQLLTRGLGGLQEPVP